MREFPQEDQQPALRARAASARRSRSTRAGIALAVLFAWVGMSLSAPLATAALTLPPTDALSVPHTGSVTLTNTTQTATFTIDLESLPPRPIFFVDASPQPGAASIVPEISIDGFSSAISSGPGACSGPDDVIQTDGSPGPQTLSWSPIGCDPRTEHLENETIQVTLRIASFGPVPAPQTIDFTFRAITQVPNDTNFIEFDPTFAQQTITLSAVKDTTIYQDAVTTSNGAGDSLWAGTRTFFGTDPFGNPVITSTSRRSLVAFDFDGSIPDSAIIDSAAITLRANSVLGNSNSVSIHRVAEDSNPAPTSWPEGDAVGSNGEFSGGMSSLPDATWLYRRQSINALPSVPWGIAGGDPVGSLFDPLGSPLSTNLVSTTGNVTFSTTALRNAAQDMLVNDSSDDGFLIVDSHPPAFNDVGVEFVSRSAPMSGRPSMLVSFTPTVPYHDQGTETAFTGAVTFTSEGQNLRWIYDVDQDDIFETDIGGICSITSNEGSGAILPYSYEFTGNPAFTGLDCCTWHLDSPDSGTLGTGQAIFFHNLDPGDPANIPPDTDGDGILDNCDNCIMVPNGPLAGSCIAGPTLGAACNSDLECGAGGDCSLSQEDSDTDFEGDACVPEPGLTALLGAGVAGLASAGSRRRRQENTCQR